MRARLICVLCVLLLCSAIWAQNKSEYRTGRLLKVDDTWDPSEPSIKSFIVLTIQDGSEQHVAYFKLRWLYHRHNDLVADKDVEYRISGNNLFVKAPNGKVIKARLCERVGSFTKCGNTAFAGPN